MWRESNDRPGRLGEWEDEVGSRPRGECRGVVWQDCELERERRIVRCMSRESREHWVVVDPPESGGQGSFELCARVLVFLRAQKKSVRPLRALRAGGGGQGELWAETEGDEGWAQAGGAH
jgi:hypothetical protein